MVGPDPTAVVAGLFVGVVVTELVVVVVEWVVVVPDDGAILVIQMADFKVNIKETLKLNF